MVSSVRTILSNRAGLACGAFAVVVVALLAAMVFAMARHVPNYDEYYTFYQADPIFGLREALVDHWLVDNHPPLFYGIARGTAWLGDGVESRRLVNLIIALAALAGGALAIRRGSGAMQIAVVFVLFLAAQPGTITEAANLRSYFLSLCAVGLLVVTLTAFWMDIRSPGILQRLILAAAIFFSFNTHIVTTIVTASIVAAFLAGAFIKRRFPLLRLILILTLISGSVFLTVSMIQLPSWLQNAQSFRGPVDFGAAVHTVVLVTWRAVKANLVISLAGAAGVAAALVKGAREERSYYAEAIMIFAAAYGISAVIVMVLSEKGLVVDRYLIGLTPLLGIILAIGFCHILPLEGRLFYPLLGLAALASLASIPRNARDAVAPPEWFTTFKLLGTQAEHCPDTAIHQLNLENKFNRSNGPDARSVVPLTYRKLAERMGFRFEREGSHRVSAQCPTIFVFWSEPEGKTAATTLGLLRDKGFQVHRIEFYRFGSNNFAVSGNMEGKVRQRMRLFDEYNNKIEK